MNQAELNKNIFKIRRYFHLENLNEEQKEERREITLLIIQNLKDILYELYFEGFLLGSNHTWGYKQNKLTINFKKDTHKVFLSIILDINNYTLETSLRITNQYSFFEDVFLKITKNSLLDSELKLIAFDWDYLTLDSSTLVLESNNFEATLVQSIRQLLNQIDEANLGYIEFYKKINKDDLFLFNEKAEIKVGWEEINNYHAHSENIKEANNKLLQYYFEAEPFVKKQIKLALAHLNLSIGHRYINVIRQMNISNEERIIIFQQIIKRVLRTIENHQMDGGAALSTRLYNNIYAGMTRGKYKVVQNRVANVSPARVGEQKIQQFEIEYKNKNGEYPKVSKLVQFGIKEAEKKQLEIDARNLRKNLKEQSLSSVASLAKDLDVLIKFEEKIIQEFIKKIKIIAESVLNDREFDFFSTRYNLNSISEKNTIKKITLQEIGDKHGLTRERVRQVEKSSLKKIKSILIRFPSGEITENYLVPIPETSAEAGGSRGISKIGRRFIDNEIYVLGQLESSGLLNIPIKDLPNHSFFNGLNESVVLKYFYSYFPDFYDAKSLDYLYASNQLSVRSFNALKNAGMVKIGDVLIDELEFINNLGSKSIEEIINLYNLLENR